MQRGDDALGWVVKQHRADADLHAEFESMRGREEGLVLANRLALVVEDGPTAAHPARVDHRATFHQRPGLGLDLLLDFAAEAVGIAEAELDLQALRWQRGARMRFAGEGRGAGRLPLGRVAEVGLLRASKTVEVVDDACGGVSQQCGGIGVRVGRSEEGVELRLREVGNEARHRVAFDRCGQRLAHHGRAHHHAQRVEGNFGLIAVRVADETRLQDAVIVRLHADAIAEGIAGFDHQQVVGVEVNEGVLAEGVAVAAQQEEMLPRLSGFAGRAIIGIRAEEGPPGGNPPMVVGITRGEVTVGLERLALQITTPVAGLSAKYGEGIGEQGFGRLVFMRALEHLRE